MLKRLLYTGAIVGGVGAVMITVVPEVASRYQVSHPEIVGNIHILDRALFN